MHRYGPGTPLDQIALLKSENAALRNMYNQLAAKVDRMATQGVSRTPQFKPSYNGGQRQPYSGGGARGGKARGGYSKDIRKSNFRGDREEDQASPGNATEYYARVGSNEKTAFAGCAWVKVQAKEGECQMGAMETGTAVERLPVCGGSGQNQDGLRRSEDEEHAEGSRYGKGRRGG
jgi:hypothetical protein